jgi:hypothetical protein
MARRISLALSSSVLILMFCFSTVALADDWDQKTMFSLNQPVTIPGRVVLPAGTYIIKRLSTVNPVLQILNESETKVYATFLPTPESVSNPPDTPTFSFKEMPEGSPMALKGFYYPGQSTEYEFPAPNEARPGHHR